MSGLFVQVYELAGAVRAVAVSDAPLPAAGVIRGDGGGPLTIHDAEIDDGAGNRPVRFVTAGEVRPLVEISAGEPRLRAGSAPGWRFVRRPRPRAGEPWSDGTLWSDRTGWVDR